MNTKKREMPSYEVYFDSRDRMSDTAYYSIFQLTHPLSNVRSVYCKSFQFQNVFQNVTSTTNYFQMMTLNAPTDIKIPSGMCTASSILQKLMI